MPGPLHKQGKLLEGKLVLHVYVTETAEPQPLVITVTPRLTQLQVISERVHELIGSLWPAGAVSNSIPVVILLVWWLGRGNMCWLFPLAAGAFIFTPR